MSRANEPTSIVHVEHFIHIWEKCGSLSNFPIVISDDARTLARLQDGLGFDDYSPMEWWFSFLCDPIELRLGASFNRPAGWRLREALRNTIGKQWRWLPPQRTRCPYLVSGTAGRMRAPSSRLWYAWIRELPKPATLQVLHRLRRNWGDNRLTGFHNDGLVTIDVSFVQGIPPEQRQKNFAQIVGRLMRDAGIWSVLGYREGRFAIHVAGNINELADRQRPLDVTWTSKRWMQSAHVTISQDRRQLRLET